MEYENFEFDKNIKPIIKRNKFTLEHLKYTHFYLDTNENDASHHYCSSFEIIFKEDDLRVLLTHTMYSLEQNKQIVIDVDSFIIPDEIIEMLAMYDLRDLGNNYLIEEVGKEYWEIEYNHKFKIVGSYEFQLELIKKLNGLYDIIQLAQKIPLVKGEE